MEDARIFDRALSRIGEHMEAAASAGSWPELEAWLCARVTDLIQQDFERLVQIMYRLDVPESKFHAAMKQADTHQCASAITKLILDREIKRAETWLKYSPSSTDSHGS